MTKFGHALFQIMAVLAQYGVAASSMVPAHEKLIFIPAIALLQGIVAYLHHSPSSASS